MIYVDFFLDFCGQMTIDNVTTTIASPLYPRDFPESITCSWVIVSDTGAQITLEILNFELLGEDRFTVGHGSNPNDEASVLLSRKGIVMPSIMILTLEGNSMWLTFDTDGNTNVMSVFKVAMQEMNFTGSDRE